MTEPFSTTSVLSVRFKADERALLEAAAEQAQTNLSDFVRRKALEAAEAEILKRSHVVIPAKDWDAFESWLERPGESVRALARLASSIPTWER